MQMKIKRKILAMVFLAISGNILFSFFHEQIFTQPSRSHPSIAGKIF